jgi:hypothetical protein
VDEGCDAVGEVLEIKLVCGEGGHLLGGFLFGGQSLEGWDRGGLVVRTKMGWWRTREVMCEKGKMEKYLTIRI